MKYSESLKKNRDFQNVYKKGKSYANRYLVMYVLIAISYYFLSKAAKKISIGVAYATWEGLGIALITLVSIVLFDANLSTQQLLGLALAVVGIVCVTLGESHGQPQQKDELPSSSNARC